ncbi:hypothetical protein ZOD2009_09930 [Haladaptatus paucihalophilus DX253]|uniref:Ribbon-helix-helix protein, copG family n=2 Tax=Haladaptatus paucihalophilus TaxID=367189 RepID=E7QSX8_HALPU|nr:hypothetical protein ZOD2009_09930 [Haladaptatus paucihalophilus DX253]SHL61726.1 Ribbon-helix-helix protein, copG family [Haladaptatus paucihalophilus DX253]
MQVVRVLCDMDQITLRLDEDVLASVEEEAEESDTTRTEFLRNVVESRHEGKRIRDSYEEQLESLQIEHGQKLSELEAEHEQEVNRLEEKVHELQAEHEQEMSELETEHEQEVSELRDCIDTLREDREEKIRLEARVDQLERDLERVREERDSAKARYNEAQGKLKVRNSSDGQDDSRGLLARLFGR